MSSLQALANGEKVENLNQHEEPLSMTELKNALPELVVKPSSSAFRRIERRFMDKPVSQQHYGLISFVPAQGATPNEKGIYGFCKLRGNFATDIEADEHAQDIIKNNDSMHKIYIPYVGRPFPITVSSDYSKNISEVQLNKDIAEVYNSDIKKKREKDMKEVEEIQEREKNLVSEIKKEAEDPSELYTTLQVKRAQLIWTYKEEKAKLAQIIKSIGNAQRDIADYDEKQPELKDQYYKKYMDARKQANLPDTDPQSTFIKYLCLDIPVEELVKE